MVYSSVYMKKFLVKPGTKIKLKDFDPSYTGRYEQKEEISAEFIKLNEKLLKFQEILFAQHKHKILVILQGMDTSGKDGTIRNVFRGVNPQGVRVASFKVPTEAELERDYLWRIHQEVPKKGEIAIFNRSHYGDVLVVRVHNLVHPKVWKRRFAQINDFEKMLTEEGTTVIKLFLHVSKGEQKKRLQARIDNPNKNWKFDLKDLDERKYWDNYTKAYEDVLSKTSTDWAPWYIVPSDRKWYRNLTVSRIIVKTLQQMDLRYPTSAEKLNNISVE